MRTNAGSVLPDGDDLKELISSVLDPSKPVFCEMLTYIQEMMNILALDKEHFFRHVKQFWFLIDHDERTGKVDHNLNADARTFCNLVLLDKSARLARAFVRQKQRRALWRQTFRNRDYYTYITKGGPRFFFEGTALELLVQQVPILLLLLLFL